VLLIGSLVIGFFSNEQAMGIKPFTTDMFKILSNLLLDMGIVSGRRRFYKEWLVRCSFAIAIPLINGCIVAVASQILTDSIGNRFIFANFSS
jgi:hypothetical protein